MNAHSYFMNAYFINVRNNLVFDKKVIRVYTTNYNNGQIKGWNKFIFYKCGFYSVANKRKKLNLIFVAVYIS